jgi:hypothetical protein
MLSAIVMVNSRYGGCGAMSLERLLYISLN